MKSAHLARRIEPTEESREAPQPQSTEPAAPQAAARRTRPRPRFEHRTIEIRDEGFAPFRVR